MTKKSTLIDQKIQKDWSDIMQQFELPADGADATVNEINSILAGARKPTFKPGGSTVLLTLAGALTIIATLYYYNSHTPLSLDTTLENAAMSAVDSEKNASTEDTTDLDVATDNSEVVANLDTAIADAPKYVTVTRDFPLNTLETLSAGDTELDTDYLQKNNWKTRVVSGKDRDSKSLLALGITKTEVSQLKKNPQVKAELERIAGGYILRAERKDGKLTQLITWNAPSENSFVISLGDNGYSGQYATNIIETRQHRTTLYINNSLRYDATQARIPQSIVRSVTKIFDRDVKLANDLNKGDRMTLVYEQIFHQGNKIADGAILAAELMHDKRAHRAIRFIMSDNKLDYFDAQGYDLSKSFERHPIAASERRISSHYGKRKHPIYKRLRMHTGVDYAAPKGTPIRATGNGTIHHIARKGGYGKTIIIKHSGGFSTLYGHMSKYAKGLKRGKKVYMGDIIGYVGSTGASTGNHLHYEFHVNGVPKNPLKFKLPKGLSLSGVERREFKENSRSLNRQLDVLQRFATQNLDITTGFGG